MQLIVMSLNFQYAGRMDSDGRPDHRWPDQVDIIRKVDPHILLGQEAHGWGADPRLQAAAEDDLGMRAHVAPSKSGAHTVVMHRTDVLEWRHWETKYHDETRHGFGVAVFDLTADPEVTVPLTVISAHLHPSSVQKAAMEAQVLIERLYRYGGMGLIGGDINHLSPADTDPDWEAVPPYNRSSRCHRRLGPQEPWLGNPLVGQTLHDGDLLDVAALIAMRLNNPAADKELFAPTGHHGGVRTDQIWVTDNMTDAVLGYQRIDTGQATDHDAVVATIDTAPLHKVQARAWI
ncbi:hypothetical protein [Actinomadura sp. 3N508]|uniref:hypothetical protein n=1 Tax=Actinomadura sp. 3N508 TaxID=3375153 RepID=UPI0037B578FB